jgi:hypothetical protein
MPPYWPDKPHKPAYRRPLNKIGHWLYLHFGLRSRFWARVWSEREVFRILRVISRQQVDGFVANPEGGDPIWSLNEAPADVQENRYPINTCLLRGWIEVLGTSGQSYKGFPIAQPLLPADGSFDNFSRPPYYRMTGAGWNALYRHYAIARIALTISFLALAVSVTVAITNWWSKTQPPALNITLPAPKPPLLDH